MIIGDYKDGYLETFVESSCDKCVLFDAENDCLHPLESCRDEHGRRIVFKRLSKQTASMVFASVMDDKK